MTRLELTEEETRELNAALETYLHGLRGELAASDMREFKTVVRTRLELLEQIAARLSEAAGEGQPLH